MQKPFRSIALIAALSLAFLPSLSAEPMGGNPRPPRGSGNANAIIMALSAMTSILGL